MARSQFARDAQALAGGCLHGGIPIDPYGGGVKDKAITPGDVSRIVKALAGAGCSSHSL
jgi:hypothetical protein